MAFLYPQSVAKFQCVVCARYMFRPDTHATDHTLRCTHCARKHHEELGVDHSILLMAHHFLGTSAQRRKVYVPSLPLLMFQCRVYYTQPAFLSW